MKLNKKGKLLTLNDIDWNAYITSFLDKHDIDNSIDSDSIKIDCDSLMLLTDYLDINKKKLDYNKILTMLDDLGSQLTYLERNNYILSRIELGDILVINKDIFLIVNTDCFSEIDSNNYTLDINSSDSLLFTSPEMRENKKLSIESSYYILACLLIYSLFNKNLSNMSDKDKLLNLEPIIDTNLYFFLLRCLHNNMENRYFVFI